MDKGIRSKTQRAEGRGKRGLSKLEKIVKMLVKRGERRRKRSFL